uniref:Uncharacterized protein n=1 Tax=Branchiostoma floridae TaxID=7739 RepID=C3Y2A4_BRAFL|eukprot:XP_002609984.1 hypothetical protein BRAFLDRAFT_131104 [Branchiostoma floridae]
MAELKAFCYYQKMAFLRAVKMKKHAIDIKDEPDELNNWDDFEPIGEEEALDDVVSFMKERGHEFSPYTVDWARETVLFVRTQEGVDLKEKGYLQLKMAFLRAVKMKKHAIDIKDEPDELNNWDDFEPIGEEEALDDVVSFMKERGHEFSPYTVDWARETVLFVRTQEGVDLKEKGYLQLAQRTYVQELLSIPFSQLQAVADAVSEKIADVRNIFIYITARCGSTLVVKATNALPYAMAIHAPDVYSIIAMAHHKVQRGETPGDIGTIPDVLRDDESTIAFFSRHKDEGASLVPRPSYASNPIALCISAAKVIHQINYLCSHR